jgi:hypothetical protein
VCWDIYSAPAQQSHTRPSSQADICGCTSKSPAHWLPLLFHQRGTGERVGEGRGTPSCWAIPASQVQALPSTQILSSSLLQCPEPAPSLRPFRHRRDENSGVPASFPPHPRARVHATLLCSSRSLPTAVSYSLSNSPLLLHFGVPAVSCQAHDWQLKNRTDHTRILLLESPCDNRYIVIPLQFPQATVRQGKK